MSKKVYAGLFLTSLATLMFELVLTRVWSVTMWYHFAFVAISIAMFGMTAGALAVYLLPGFFRIERTPQLVAYAALLFSLTMVSGFLTQLCIPLIGNKSLLGLYSAALTYAVIAIPFCFSGICIALILSRYPAFAGRLYAADLAGAATGCVLLVWLLQLMDGPTAVVATAFLAAAGALLFAVEAREKRCARAAMASGVVLLAFTVFSTTLAANQHTLLRLPWIRGAAEQIPEYEKWNAFSRVTVSSANDSYGPFGWGLSPALAPGFKPVERQLALDGFFATVLTGFSGNLADVSYLKSDVSNIAHHLRSGARVLVIGAGGGRDILAALAFRQKSIVAVEINDTIINLLKTRYADFTGHLDRDPRITLVNDEARSYIARQKRLFDVIQLSLIDTGTASASGAFALTENSLYTREAWKLFLRHLEPGGIISCTRWYFAGCPGEIYRLTAVARSALNDSGVNDPRAHIAVVRCVAAGAQGSPDGVGTILVSNKPLTGPDLDSLEKVAKELNFEIVLSPRTATDPNLVALASGAGIEKLATSLPSRISPSTDDCPFFFFLAKPENLFRTQGPNPGTGGLNIRAPVILAQLVIVVTLLTLLCVLLPLITSGREVMVTRNWPVLTYFAAIGFGFMFFEISQLERLIIFLGHPTYGITVVLFTLLLASGAGSYLTTFATRYLSKTALICMATLLCILALSAALAPLLLQSLAGATTPFRIAIAACILAPPSLLMGTAFPLGVRFSAERCPHLIPWLWGINGASSVGASVYAIAIAIAFGISAAYWLGFASYLIALFSLACISRETGQTLYAQALPAEQEQGSAATRAQDTPTS